MPNSLKCRLKKFVHKGLLSEKDLSRLYTDNDVVEELEKIKAEIKRAVSDFYMENGDIAYGLTVAECILDNHISELKGEQRYA